MSYIQDCLNRSVYGLYIHVPFCSQKCYYCDFESAATCHINPIIEAYIQKIRWQYDLLEYAGFFQELKTVYIGGGTPSVASESLPSLIRRISSNCTLQECTSEANPESATKDFIQRAQSAGLTRMSFGVQSCVEKELKAIGRIHTPQKAIEALVFAKDYGLQVSCDLMLGIPHQTLDSLSFTLDQVLSINPHHISAYPLQLEESTPLFSMVKKGLVQVASQEQQAEFMQLVEQKLLEFQYKRYEVASYAQSGFECKHNKGYWSAQPYVGLGVSASSMLTPQQYAKLCVSIPKLNQLDEIDVHDCTRIRITCISSTQDFVNASSLNDLSFEVEYIDTALQVGEDLMLASRLQSGIEQRLLETAGSLRGKAGIDTLVRQLIHLGLVKKTKNRLVPTTKGWLLGNELYGRLLMVMDGNCVTKTYI